MAEEGSFARSPLVAEEETPKKLGIGREVSGAGWGVDKGCVASRKGGRRVCGDRRLETGNWVEQGGREERKMADLKTFSKTVTDTIHGEGGGQGRWLIRGMNNSGRVCAGNGEGGRGRRGPLLLWGGLVYPLVRLCLFLFVFVQSMLQKAREHYMFYFGTEVEEGRGGLKLKVEAKE